MLTDIKSRLFNLHTVTGIGIVLAAFGFVTPGQVDGINAAVGGDPALAAVGVGLVALAKVLRKH